MEAFYYVDGIPLKGMWIDLENIYSIDEVLEALAQDGFISRNDDGNPVYDSDLLVADIDGDLPAHFLDRYDVFDLAGFIEARDCGFDAAIVAAYLDIFTLWDVQRCTENYLGKYDSPEDYAYQYIEDTGLLSSLPDNLQGYFDYAAFARDLLISDISESNGHYFSNY